MLEMKKYLPREKEKVNLCGRQPPTFGQGVHFANAKALSGEASLQFSGCTFYSQFV